MKSQSLRPTKAIRFLSAAVILWILAAPAFAQSQKMIISKIAADGSARFSDSQISSASGLKLGQPADDSALSSAADLLSKSGEFSEVTYRYTSTNGKMAVVFHVVDEPKSMSCTFDNFIWVSPEEADRAVREEVPLYDGRVPLDGDVVPAVATALEHLLAKHHVTATVSYIPASRTLGKAPDEFRYSAIGNLPPVASVEFSGGPLDPAIFATPKQRLMGHPFSAAYARSLIQNDLDVIYQNHAYLRAHFNDPQVSLVPGPNDSDPGTVSLVFTVIPGPVYAWHGADWDGNTVYPSAELDRDLGMKDGDPAALDKISAGMDAIREAYGVKGYMAVRLSPKQNLDDATHQVRYSFHLNEGSQYHMGTLSVTGTDDKTAERIRNLWRLKSGEIYDSSYLKEFGEKGLADALSGSPATTRSARVSMSVHPQNTLNVDVTISLSTD